MNTNIKTGGITEISIKDKDGKVKKLFHVNSLWKIFKRLFHVDLKIPFLFGEWSDKSLRFNTITTVGKALAASQLAGTTTAPLTHIALGGGTPSATALGSEFNAYGAARAAATVTIDTVTLTNDAVKLYKKFTITGTITITEEGIFNNSSGGVMVASQTFSGIDAVNLDEVEITHKIYFSS